MSSRFAATRFRTSALAPPGNQAYGSFVLEAAPKSYADWVSSDDRKVKGIVDIRKNQPKTNDYGNQGANTKAAENLDALVELYCALLSKSSQEGDGIWSRFNVMVSINFGLFAAFVFVFQTDKPNFGLHRQFLLSVICLVGIVASIWSFYVLLRLWEWQQYWRDQLKKVEQGFPKSPGWVRSFTPEGEDSRLLMYDPGVKRSVWFGYTQPFMAIFVTAWIVLLTISIFSSF